MKNNQKLKERFPEYYENFQAKTGTLRDRDDKYYDMLGGGARLRLLEGMFDLQLIELLVANGPMTGSAICQRLALHPQRGWKFLHCLALADLLNEYGAEFGSDQAIFSLSDTAKKYFGEDGSQMYYFKDLVTYWRNVAELPFVASLQGMPLPEAVKWPPPNIEMAEHLEEWMRITASGAIDTAIFSNTFENAKTLLDVGGGDGTLGCALSDKYPELDVTVFNLPASAYIARRVIGEKNKMDKVSVYEGDFLNEELPKGYDRVMYSRVLTDWTPEVCTMLLEKAKKSLNPGGKVVINEALLDGNTEYSIAWEFRYIFYDTFGRNMYKTLDHYETILEKAGLKIDNVTPMIDNAFYNVIESVPIEVD